MDLKVRYVVAALVVAGAATAGSLPAVSALDQSNASTARTTTASPGVIRVAEAKKKGPPPKAAPKAPPPKKAVTPKVTPKPVTKTQPKTPVVKTTPTAPKKTAPTVKKTPPVKTTPVAKKPTTKTTPITKTAPTGPTKTQPVTKTAPKTIAPQTVTPKTVTPKTITKGPAGPKAVKGVQKNLTPKVGKRPPGSRTVINSTTRNVTIINNRTVQVYTGPRRVYFGGVPRTLIAVGGLAAIAVAGISYYPQGYVVLARPICQGVTEAGCALQWQAVATDDGFTVPQCVQYCRQGYVAPPPPPVAVMAPPQAVASGGCLVEIFSDANFAGETSETTEAQPDLEQVGWEDAITSVQVRMGVWDFFSEPDFAGETIRLEPGSYPVLPKEWLNRINSFMCSEPT